MNHLRELLSSLTADNGARCVVEVREKDAVSLFSRFESLAEHAICFHGGRIENVEGIAIIREIARMPFSTCWFEYDCDAEESIPAHIAGCLIAEHESTSEGFWWRKMHGHWTLMGWATKNNRQFFTSAPGSSIEYSIVPATDNGRDIFHVMHSIVSAFLSALNCTNINRVCHMPDEKLQRARAKRGKKPLFSYWTLELHPERSEGARLGGTHASPRLHLRRGHPRQYAPGKYTWVQPHVVGNKALGMIHKDYDGSKLSSVGRTLQ